MNQIDNIKSFTSDMRFDVVVSPVGSVIIINNMLLALVTKRKHTPVTNATISEETL